MIEVESWTQGSRTQKISEVKAKDRTSRDQGQEPRAHAQVFSQKKGLQNFFSGDLKNEKVFKKVFQAKKVFKFFFSGDLHLRKTRKDFRKFSARFLAFSNKISTVQKIVLSSSRGQGNFRGLEASRPRPRTSKCVLEAKDVIKDSTSAK